MRAAKHRGSIDASHPTASGSNSIFDDEFSSAVLRGTKTLLRMSEENLIATKEVLVVQKSH